MNNNDFMIRSFGRNFDSHHNGSKLKSNALVATDLRSGADFLTSPFCDYNVLSHKYHSTQVTPEGDTEQRTDKRRNTNEIKDFIYFRSIIDN